MSTQLRPPQSMPGAGPPRIRLAAHPSPLPVAAIAPIVLSRRDALLRVHARRLRRADLEDCFSQAALELFARALSGSNFSSIQHVTNALDQKFTSRITDRRRALSGRSALEAALERAPATYDPEGEVYRLADGRAGTEDLVARRAELARIREVAFELSPDQQRWLALHAVLDMGCDEFCARHGWTAEKFRKVGQRARRRLAGLLDEYAAGERCRRLEPDLRAEAARRAAGGTGVSDAPGGAAEGSLRIRRHVANCPSCRLRLGQTTASYATAAVPPAAGRSDQQTDPPMTPANPHRRVRRDAESLPRDSHAIPLAVRGGRTDALAVLRPAAHVPHALGRPAGEGA